MCGGLLSERSSTASALQRRLLALLQQRLDTFRAALSEFAAGYHQGLHEVRFCPVTFTLVLQVTDVTNNVGLTQLPLRLGGHLQPNLW
jgi:hypothetical protein